MNPAKPAHYLDVYRDLFTRHTIGFVLELGIHKGDSLRFWRSLGATRVVGIDSSLAVLEGEFAGIEVIEGNATDADLLARFAPDLAVDDASHLWSDQRASFEALWPRTGLYVIEDLDTSYHPDWASGENTMDWLIREVHALHQQKGRFGSMTFHPGMVVLT